MSWSLKIAWNKRFSLEEAVGNSPVREGGECRPSTLNEARTADTVLGRARSLVPHLRRW